MKNLLKTTSIGAFFLAPMAFGAGFQLNELGVAAMGRAQAGEPAMSDSAASIARNPATMGFMEKTMASVAYHYIDPNIDVEGDITTPIPAISANGDADDIAPSASVPGLYFANPINEQWAVGVAINSHFGLSTDYGKDYPGTEFAQETSIKTYYVTPSVSFKPVESLALGLGINYIYGEGVIKNSSTPAIQSSTTVINGLNPLVPIVPDNTTLLDLEGDGDAWGYQLGLVWEAAKGHRLGLRYQSSVDLDFEGDITYLREPTAKTGTLTVNLPEMTELGYVGSISDRFRIMAGVQHNGWSKFRSLTADIDQGVGETELKDEDWKDSWRYSVGAEFDSDEMVTLRAGLGRDTSPVKDDKRTLTIPDADRDWMTVGATFHLKELGSIDAALMYISGDSVEVTETSSLGTTFTGELSSVDVLVYSIGYNYAF